MRVRIAVSVTADGRWNAAGWGDIDDKDATYHASEGFDGEPFQIHWIEADVPEFVQVPVMTVQGEVV